MSYTRIINVVDDEQLLSQRRQELEELIHYPNAERITAAIAKVTMASLVGFSTLATFVVFAPPISILAVIFFAGGAFIYAIKAARDAHKKRHEERQLINDIISTRNKMRALFTMDFILTLDGLIGFSKSNQLSEDETESLYTHLFELKEAIATAFPEPQVKSTEKQVITEGIDEVCKQVRRFRQLLPGTPCKPNLGVICFEESEAEEAMTLGRFARKAGNRMLSFMAGASSAAGIGLTVAAIGFGVSNPVGWALAGILVVSCLVGAVSVAIDYYLSRREDNAIKLLQQRKRELGTLDRGVQILQQSMKRICNHKQESMINKRLQAENAELARRLQVRDSLSQFTVSGAQPATIFGSPAEMAIAKEADVRSSLILGRVQHR